MKVKKKELTSELQKFLRKALQNCGAHAGNCKGTFWIIEELWEFYWAAAQIVGMSRQYLALQFQEE